MNGDFSTLYDSEDDNDDVAEGSPSRKVQPPISVMKIVSPRVAQLISSESGETAQTTSTGNLSPSSLPKKTLDTSGLKYHSSESQSSPLLLRRQTPVTGNSDFLGLLSPKATKKSHLNRSNSSPRIIISRMDSPIITPKSPKPKLKKETTSEGERPRSKLKQEEGTTWETSTDELLEGYPLYPSLESRKEVFSLVLPPTIVEDNKNLNSQHFFAPELVLPPSTNPRKLMVAASAQPRHEVFIQKEQEEKTISENRKISRKLNFSKMMPTTVADLLLKADRLRRRRHSDPGVVNSNKSPTFQDDSSMKRLHQSKGTRGESVPSQLENGNIPLPGDSVLAGVMDLASPSNSSKRSLSPVQRSSSKSTSPNMAYRSLSINDELSSTKSPTSSATLHSLHEKPPLTELPLSPMVQSIKESISPREKPSSSFTFTSPPMTEQIHKSSSLTSPQTSPKSSKKKDSNQLRKRGFVSAPRFGSPPPQLEYPKLPRSISAQIEDPPQLPMRKTSSFASVASVFAVKRERSPNSSPQRRRPSFNFTALDSTIASLKQRLLRRTSGGNSPTPIEDRKIRRHQSNSVTSLMSENSDGDDYFLEGRRGSDANDSFSSDDDHYDYYGNEQEQLDEAEEEETDGIPEAASVENLLISIGNVEKKRRRDDLFQALFLSSIDFCDPYSMTSYVLDFVEESQQIEVLEQWLIKYRGIDKLKFFDPSVSARVREFIMTFLVDENGEDSEDMEQNNSADGSVIVHAAREYSEDVSSTDEEEEIDDEDDENRKRSIAQKLLKSLNKSELEVVDNVTTTNEWGINSEEILRGPRRLSLPTVREPYPEDLGRSMCRSSSLPSILIWSMREVQNNRRKREYSSMSSYGSFITKSSSTNIEEEEYIVSEMLAHIVVPLEQLHQTRTFSLEDLTFPDNSSDDGGVISPRSSFQSRRHSKQASSSSLLKLNSTTRKSAPSTSFSSFTPEFELPEKQFRHDIKKYSPALVAEQLMATMCRSAFFELNEATLRTLEARKRDIYVQRLVRYFEVLSNWPCSEILGDAKRTASDRIDDFGYFVSLAKACREVGNYHAVFAIVSGLQSPLLAWVTQIAHRKDKNEFKVLKRLVRPDNNYRVYHADLSKRVQIKPCIPYLGLLNRILLNLESDVHALTETGLVNFVRCRRIYRALSQFLKWQQKLQYSNGVVVDHCVRKALGESMSRSVLNYRDLSVISSKAKSSYVKSVRQRAFHRARTLGHQIVGEHE